MTNNQSTLDLGGEKCGCASEDLTTLAHGQKAWKGNWEIRNFHGFYQSREGGAGDWQFHISGFDSTTTGQSGSCSLSMANGGHEDVPIDAADRITILGKKYGRKNWKH